MPTHGDPPNAAGFTIKTFQKTMPTSKEFKELLAQQAAEERRAQRKERFYIAGGFVVAFCAAYGAMKLGPKIEAGICELGFPQYYDGWFLTCGVINPDPYIWTGLIVFFIALTFSLKAVAAIRKERSDRQAKAFRDQLERETLD